VKLPAFRNLKQDETSLRRGVCAVKGNGTRPGSKSAAGIRMFGGPRSKTSECVSRTLVKQNLRVVKNFALRALLRLALFGLARKVDRTSKGDRYA
jgi:hypothetical protein